MVRRKRIAPGIYATIDDKGPRIDFDIPEILRHQGIKDTPEARDKCGKQLAQELAAPGRTIDIEHRPL